MVLVIGDVVGVMTAVVLGDWCKKKSPSNRCKKEEDSGVTITQRNKQI